MGVRSVSEASPALVLVTVGSDHHPFHRLITWVDSWLRETEVPTGLRCIVQYGTSAAPTVAEGHEFADHDQLQSWMREAAVIVTQGGPMSIVEARRAGKVPIVVPRDPELGEHVDGHQQRFAHRLADNGLIRIPHTQQELAEMLTGALADPQSVAAAEDTEALERVATTTSAVAVIADRLVATRRGR